MRNPQCLPYQDASSRTIWKKKLVHFDIYAEITPYYNEPSGWKGSVTYGLGADISLPHCLATGIWTLAPKAITGPKSRGTSLGTTLWHHVQRYCTNFPLFMQIIWSAYSFLRRGEFIRRLGLSFRAENLASLSCTSHYEVVFYFTSLHPRSNWRNDGLFMQKCS